MTTEEMVATEAKTSRQGDDNDGDRRQQPRRIKSVLGSKWERMGQRGASQAESSQLRWCQRGACDLSF